jgi:acetylornithine deacetylase/succinyl-diaminopimelate desuccinylase-like protein
VGSITIREMMTELASSTFPGHDTWQARLLNYVDEHATQIVADLAGLVRMPSVSGSDNEIDIQHLLSDRMVNMDLDVDARGRSRSRRCSQSRTSQVSRSIARRHGGLSAALRAAGVGRL